ncbi:MAG: LysR family transcriptional regulator [Eggerthellaceae bacterium]|nr:LysR family transcriptional regulator [Eggerthellaceae bacterium]
MELEQLEQLTVIAECGTLSKAAEQLHISQSALSRSIQRLEAELDCPLFSRTKNHMSLNDAGAIALEHARSVLAEATRLKEAIAEHSRKRFTLHVSSCAPAPLWRMVPVIGERSPELLVVPKLDSLKAIQRDLMSGIIDMAILPFDLRLPNTIAIPFMSEDLRAALPEGHALANRSSIKLSELDGETFLMYHGVGFWREVLEKHVPNAHYVLQDDYLIFSQLSQTSPLPGFITDASETERFVGNRRIVPIEDADAHATYHLTMLSQNDRWSDLAEWIGKRLTIGEGISPRCPDR